MSRHHTSRRRAYGRRQHELHERQEPLRPWGLEPAEDGLGFDGAPEPFDSVEDVPGLQLGHLFGHQRWRFAQGRG